MPNKRYLGVLILAVLFSLKGIFGIAIFAFMSLFAPGEIPATALSHLTLANYLVAAVVLMINIYLLRRFYLVVVKKEPVITPGANGAMSGLQKMSAHCLNAGYLILTLATLGLFMMLVFPIKGGMSGVPFGIALALVVFLFFVSMVTMEIGSLLNNRLSSNSEY